jgi:hypothetical protein
MVTDRALEADHFSWPESTERRAGEIKSVQAADDPDRGDTSY